jgi:hypothetical protein
MKLSDGSTITDLLINTIDVKIECIEDLICAAPRIRERDVHEKTRAAAAPMKPKKGAISSPLKTVDIL